MEEDIDDYYDSMDTPKKFFSEVNDKAFQECNFCEAELTDSNYFIEKAFKNYDGKHEDVLFEYAICTKCYGQIQSSISKDSKKKLAAFFAKNIDFEARAQKLAGSEQLEDYISHCAISGKPREECSEYQIMGQFISNKLLLDHLPMMISDTVMEQVQELFSPETKEEMDDFMNRIQSPSPDLKELFEPVKVFII